MLACFLLSKGANSVSLALFSLVTFLGWISQQTLAIPELGFSLVAFFSPEFMSSTTQTIASAKRLPLWGRFLRDYFKYSFVLLFGMALIATLIILVKTKSKDKVTISMMSLLFSAIAMLWILFFPDWDIERLISFLIWPAAFSPVILLKEATKIPKFNCIVVSLATKTKKLIYVSLLVFTISLSATVMMLRFERNYYFGEVMHPSELSALSFFSAYDYNSTVNIVSWRTSIHFEYFNHYSTHKVLRLGYLEISKLEGDSRNLLNAESSLIDQAQSIVRGVRDSYTLGLQDTNETVLILIDSEMILPKFNLIYSNEYYSVYERALPKT